jgi:hypothetical protein
MKAYIYHVRKSWLLLCKWDPTRGCLQHTRMSRSLSYMVRPYDAHTHTHTHTHKDAICQPPDPECTFLRFFDIICVAV